MSSGWIGVDLDGTLAFYEGAQIGIGAPIEAMRERVLKWLAQGFEVRIFTARAGDPLQVEMVRLWLDEHGMGGLAITNVKDFDMIELWDDRAVQVELNTGLAMNETSPLTRQLTRAFNKKPYVPKLRLR